jgi:hypothetical protein
MKVVQDSSIESNRMMLSSIAYGDTFRMSDEESIESLYLKLENGGYVSMRFGYFWTKPEVDLKVVKVNATVTWSY